MTSYGVLTTEAIILEIKNTQIRIQDMLNAMKRGLDDTPRDTNVQEKFILCNNSLAACENKNKKLEGNVAQCKSKETELQTTIHRGLTDLTAIEQVVVENDDVLQRIDDLFAQSK